MGNKVHWTKGELFASVAANTCNLSAPVLSASAVAATLFTGGIVATLGNTPTGCAMLLSAWPQAKLFQLNLRHAKHTVKHIQHLAAQHTWIEQEDPGKAWRRCSMAFTRLAAPLVIFAAGYGLARMIEPPATETTPTTTYTQSATP